MMTSGHDTPPSPTKSTHLAQERDSSTSATTAADTSTTNLVSPKATPSTSSAFTPIPSRDSSPTRSRARAAAHGNNAGNASNQQKDQLKQQQLPQQQQQPQQRHRQQLSSPRRPDRSETSPVTALHLLPSESRSTSHDPSPTRAPSSVNVNANAASFNSNLSNPSVVAAPVRQKSLNASVRSSASSSGTNSPLRSLSPRNSDGDKSKGSKPLPSKTVATNSSTSSSLSRARSRLSSPKGTNASDAGHMVAPSIVVEDSSPVMSDSSSTTERNNAPAIPPMDGIVESDDGHGPLPVKVRSSTTTMPTKLETVEEGSQPATPGNEISQMLSMSNTKSKQSDKDNRKTSDGEASGYFSDSNAQSHENNNESLTSGRTNTYNLQQQQRKRDTPNNNSNNNNSNESETAPRSRLLSTKSSLSRLAPSKSRSRAEPSTQNMTVETETVSSIPQTPITMNHQADRAGSGRTDYNGSIKLKPSNETIRPKRERKWTSRKPISVAAGNASSKADVFEAKVASAVDEANSSDSEETFVYESNPPEPSSRLGRHHSRTPSTTSMHSIADQRGLRSIGTVLDGTRGILGKKSMKFSTNSYNNPSGDDGAMERVESGRHSRNGTAGGGGVHHHHIGRFGRGAPAANQPYFLSESDSQFTQTNKGRHSQHSSRPSSPGHANAKSRLYPLSTRKNGEHSPYNMDLEASANERTPLMMSTVRTNRNRIHRRPNGSNVDLHHLHYFPNEERGGFFGRCAGCFSITFLALVVILSALAFLLATTKPLYSIHVQEIQNVLASEQELMLDLFVQAVNPNLVSITVADMDVNVFAKSKYVGSEKWWRDHGGPFPAPHFPRDGCDDEEGEEAGDGRDDDDDDDDDNTGAEAGDRRKGNHHAPSSSSPEGSRNSTLGTTSSSTSLMPSTSNSTPNQSASYRKPAKRRTYTENTYHILVPRSEISSPDPFFPDPSHDAQTMLLGRIFHFDSPLTFEGTAFKRHPHRRTGEVRLRHPGNKTEAGGTERWERVLQHRFDLIVRGVLKYQLPLSSRVFSAPIQGKVVVLPEDGDDGGNGDGDGGGNRDDGNDGGDVDGSGSDGDSDSDGDGNGDTDKGDEKFGTNRT